jgi:hypothetical protein
MLVCEEECVSVRSRTDEGDTYHKKDTTDPIGSDTGD